MYELDLAEVHDRIGIRIAKTSASFLQPPQPAARDHPRDGNQSKRAQQFRAGTLAQCVGCEAQRILASGDRLISAEASTGAEQSGGRDYLQGWSRLERGTSQREGH